MSSVAWLNARSLRQGAAPWLTKRWAFSGTMICSSSKLSVQYRNGDAAQRRYCRGPPRRGKHIPDGMTAGKTGDRRFADGLESGRRNIGGFHPHSTGLHIGLYNHAAARRYRVNLLCILGQGRW